VKFSKTIWLSSFIVAGFVTGYYANQTVIFLRAGGIACDTLALSVGMSIVLVLAARVLHKRWRVSYLHIISILALGAVFSELEPGMVCMTFEGSRLDRLVGGS